MVAKITTGSNIYGALAYNQEKVDLEKGAVLATHILREPVDGRFSVAETADDLMRWMPEHVRTEKPVIHISLNPDPKDTLTDGQLAEIAEKYMERMGWGEQPYIVFKHTDIGREHIHIVSVQVGRDGRKIKDGRRNERSVAVTEELEREYGLHPAKGQKRTEGWQLRPVDYTRGDLKRQIASVVRPALSMYRFQTLGEFRALLTLYNTGVEEVRGMRNGQPYRGLLYAALDGNGRKAEVTPIKSSMLGKSCGYDALEKLMARSTEKIAGDGSREQARRRIAAAFAGTPTGSELRERLKAYHIDIYIRRNADGRITGATFIDHETRTVLNGSRLGKEYSANALQERFGAGLESGAGSHGEMQHHSQSLIHSHETPQPTPPTVLPTSETRQSRPAQKRVVPKRKTPKRRV